MENESLNAESSPGVVAPMCIFAVIMALLAVVSWSSFKTCKVVSDEARQQEVQQQVTNSQPQ